MPPILVPKRAQNLIEVVMAEASEHTIRDAKLFSILGERQARRRNQVIVLNVDVGFVHPDDQGEVRAKVFDLPNFPAPRPTASYCSVRNGPGDCNNHGEILRRDQVEFGQEGDRFVAANKDLPIINICPVR